MTTLTADDISLTQTCGACPEQYDAYDPDGRQVGYLRLRHGWFTVDMPGAGGTEVYSAQPEGDGVFTPDERDGYLRTARETIAEHLNPIRAPEEAGMIYGDEEKGYVIASGGMWLPGIYATKQAARAAFQLDTAVLQRLADAICKESRGKLRITSEDLRGASVTAAARDNGARS